MSLKAGIVGLPNVGKSTLFNAITNSNVLAQNYPFATIEPNSGVVTVSDERFDKLCEIFKPKSKVKATFEFTDIAGLVKGASKGEGLGNQFLGNIRAVDAIIHVVRCFDNSEIIHVEGSVDPIRDIETINLELVMADLDVVTKRKDKIFSKAKNTKDKDMLAELDVLEKLIPSLTNGDSALSLKLDQSQLSLISNLNLLTLKPTIYVANVSESAYGNPDEDKYFQQVKEYALKNNSKVIPVCASTEVELSQVSEEEKEEFKQMLNIKLSGLELITRTSYDLLGLQTFFTTGSDEVRAWTFTKGMSAPQCAGVIHSDFQKGFIKAEVYSCENIFKFQSELELKNHGLIDTVGKDYLVKDGDCLFFKFNVTK